MPLVVPGVTPASKKAEKNNDDKKIEETLKDSAQAHQAQPGPVIPKDQSVFENKASREELDARKAELNK